MTDIDTSRIAAEVVTTLIKQGAAAAAKGASEKMKSAWLKIRGLSP